MSCLYLSEGEGKLVQDGALVEELATVAVVVVLVHTLPHVLGQLVVPHVLVHLVQLWEGQTTHIHGRDATEALFNSLRTASLEVKVCIVCVLPAMPPLQTSSLCACPYLLVVLPAGGVHRMDEG